MLSNKEIALRFLCWYAILYPLATHYLMSSVSVEGAGSAPIQALQILTIFAMIGCARVRFRSIFDLGNVWVLAAFFFVFVAVYFAIYYAQEERMVELTYAARFLTWFLFAFLASVNAFTMPALERLARSFWIGSVIQGLLALRAFRTQDVDSIYNEVYATTGAAYVSGKMVVAFVMLGAFLSFYWFLTRTRWKSIYLGTLALAFFVLLASYNRAAQLGVTLVLGYTLIWTMSRGRFKTSYALIVVALLLVVVVLLTPADVILLRWRNIQDDGGSGRVKLVAACLQNLFSPNSAESLFIGQGYLFTRRLMYQACGAYIGAHSDFFDFLTSYGLFGAAFYCAIAYKILTFGRDLYRNMLEFWMIRASALFIILTGLFTGLFQATYTYFMLFTLMYYCYGRAKQKEAAFEAYLTERAKYDATLAHWQRERDMLWRYNEYAKYARTVGVQQLNQIDDAAYVEQTNSTEPEQSQADVSARLNQSDSQDLQSQSNLANDLAAEGDLAEDALTPTTDMAVEQAPESDVTLAEKDESATAGETLEQGSRESQTTVDALEQSFVTPSESKPVEETQTNAPVGVQSTLSSEDAQMSAIDASGKDAQENTTQQASARAFNWAADALAGIPLQDVSLEGIVAISLPDFEQGDDDDEDDEEKDDEILCSSPIEPDADCDVTPAPESSDGAAQEPEQTVSESEFIELLWNQGVHNLVGAIDEQRHEGDDSKSTRQLIDAVFEQGFQTVLEESRQRNPQSNEDSSTTKEEDRSNHRRDNFEPSSGRDAGGFFHSDFRNRQSNR